MGARGSWKLNFAVGEIPSIEFTFISRFQRPYELQSSDTILTGNPDASTLIAPQVCTSRNTNVAGLPTEYFKCVHNLEIDCGTVNTPRECLNAKNDGSGLDILMTDRQASGSISLDVEILTHLGGAIQAGDPWGIAGKGISRAALETVSDTWSFKCCCHCIS